MPCDYLIQSSTSRGFFKLIKKKHQIPKPTCFSAGMILRAELMICCVGGGNAVEGAALRSTCVEFCTQRTNNERMNNIHSAPVEPDVLADGCRRRIGASSAPSRWSPTGTPVGVAVTITSLNTWIISLYKTCVLWKFIKRNLQWNNIYFIYFNECNWIFFLAGNLLDLLERDFFSLNQISICGCRQSFCRVLHDVDDILIILLTAQAHLLFNFKVTRGRLLLP